MLKRIISFLFVSLQGNIDYTRSRYCLNMTVYFCAFILWVIQRVCLKDTSACRGFNALRPSLALSLLTADLLLTVWLRPVFWFMPWSFFQVQRVVDSGAQSLRTGFLVSIFVSFHALEQLIYLDWLLSLICVVWKKCRSL